MRKPIVLAIMLYYLPGYKAGGPIRTVANIVGWLKEEFTFVIINRDRDLRDTDPYSTVTVDAWQPVEGAQVYYASTRMFRPDRWLRLLRQTDYDVIYLNSFFAFVTVLTVGLRWLRLLRRTPVIIAPRGEFARSALTSGSLKKSMYIRLIKLLGVYKGMLWQASSELEKDDIIREMGIAPEQIHVAVDLPPYNPPTLEESTVRPPKQSGAIRLAFVARIVPVKNLAYALDLLAKLPGSIEYDVYGFIEDAAYWESCQAQIARLPANVRVEYRGMLLPHHVIPTLAQYHALLLPTRGENFGHAILEALSAGCVPIISDQTPWQSLQADHAGWSLPLADPEGFADALRQMIAMNADEWGEWSHSALAYVTRFANDSGVVGATRSLFKRALPTKS